jgi:hypothetical protein
MALSRLGLKSSSFLWSGQMPLLLTLGLVGDFKAQIFQFHGLNRDFTLGMIWIGCLILFQ